MSVKPKDTGALLMALVWAILIYIAVTLIRHL